MGNLMYRPTPKKIYTSVSGSTALFKFAANQITGWRISQEDRFVCIPEFYQDFSLFAVYDGHGGEEVAQYLYRFLHQYILRELEVEKDVKLALYLSFLNCDTSLRNITEAEHALIEKDLEKVFPLELKVPDKSERRKILFGARTDEAGTSGRNQEHDELRAAIVSSCLKQLPSVSFLTEAPMEASDESDVDYQPGDEDINYLTGEKDSSDERSQSEFSSESIEDDSMDVPDKEEKIDENAASTSKEDTCEFKKKKDQECSEERALGQQVVMNCGSTATVLLINRRTLYIAHVGDSRCIASIQGRLCVLTTDHRPTDEDEAQRILNAGGRIINGRIEADIDMSRAFGDFRYKPLDNPHQILAIEPSISSVDISPELEFIIVASDGIWNTMESQDVFEYVGRRLKEPELELKDLIGELFEELVPDRIATEGDGCDNLTAILLQFKKSEEMEISKTVQDVYEYNYSRKEKSN